MRQTTHKRIRPAATEPGSGSSPTDAIPTRSAATRRVLAKKNLSVHGYLLPQLEDFESQWPGIPQWSQNVKFDDQDGVFRQSLVSGQYGDAWRMVTLKTAAFIEDQLFPVFEEFKNRPDGKAILLAFVGLHKVLFGLAGKISVLFLEQSSGTAGSLCLID